jgi:hypothetical protein
MLLQNHNLTQRPTRTTPDNDPGQPPHNGPQRSHHG